LRQVVEAVGLALSGGRERAVAHKSDDDDTVFQESPAHQRAELEALKALRESYEAEARPPPPADTKRNAASRDTPGQSA